MLEANTEGGTRIANRSHGQLQVMRQGFSLSLSGWFTGFTGWWDVALDKPRRSYLGM